MGDPIKLILNSNFVKPRSFINQFHFLDRFGIFAQSIALSLRMKKEYNLLAIVGANYLAPYTPC